MCNRGFPVDLLWPLVTDVRVASRLVARREGLPHDVQMKLYSLHKNDVHFVRSLVEQESLPEMIFEDLCKENANVLADSPVALGLASNKSTPFYVLEKLASNTGYDSEVYATISSNKACTTELEEVCILRQFSCERGL